MLKINKLCKVCVAVKESPKLLDDIFATTAYIKSSKVSLAQLHKDYANKFSYRALMNHVKHHQFLSDEDFKERHLRDIAKKAERQVLKRQIESSQVWDEVITQGMEKLQTGELSMKTADLLKAAKDKSDFELKTKDQELAFAEMMYFFASGENQSNLRKPYDRRFVEGETVENNHPSSPITGNSGEGENGPSPVYYPPSWDAAAFGASEVSPRNDN